jgi:hypothetical protein
MAKTDSVRADYGVCRVIRPLFAKTNIFRASLAALSDQLSKELNDLRPANTVNVHSLLQQEQLHGAIGIGTSNGA